MSNRGTVSGGEDLAAQPQVPGRSRIVEQAVTAADQEHGQHDREDQRRPVPGSGGCSEPSLLVISDARQALFLASLSLRPV